MRDLFFHMSLFYRHVAEHMSCPKGLHMLLFICFTSLHSAWSRLSHSRPFTLSILILHAHETHRSSTSAHIETFESLHLAIKEGREAALAPVGKMSEARRDSTRTTPQPINVPPKANEPTQCHEKPTSVPAPDASAAIPPHDEKTSIQDTSFNECKWENVSFSGCTIYNSYFYRCKFQNVSFRGVRLKNVLLVGLDLRNVRFYNLDLRETAWMNMLAHNMVMSDVSFTQMGDGKIGLHVSRAPSCSRVAPLPSVDSYDECHLEWPTVSVKRNPVQQIVPESTVSSLQQLMAHENIMRGFMNQVMPGHTCYIHSVPTSSKRIAGTKQTTARVYSSCKTYVGSAKSPAEFNKDAPNDLDLCTNLMLVSKAISAAVKPYLYGREFQLVCDSKVGIAFLQDHCTSGIERLRLCYSSRYFSDIGNDLLRYIRHHHSSLKTIKVEVGAYFWKHIDWQRGVEQLLELEGSGLIRSNYFEPHHFLRELAKNAAPAERWLVDAKRKIDKSKPPARCDGTVLEIHIEGADTDEKMEFVRRLGETVMDRGTRRPLFVGKEIVLRPAKTSHMCLVEYYEKLMAQKEMARREAAG